MSGDVLSELRALDATLRDRGLVVWIGSEPTFTRRESQDAAWLWQAEGADKEARARELLAALRLDGPAIVRRVHGRQFPGEAAPRFAYGALFRRDGREVAKDDPFTLARADDEPRVAPRIDEHHAWLTVTPDPGVVEINLAPAPDLETFYRWTCDVFDAARAAGLSPVRYRYNGQVSDSGGGGQITLGGPRAEASPFFEFPQLLPGLLRYVNRHPSLSYWFAPECTGSASQGPRADEGVRERFEELAVALDLLATRTAPSPSPDELWSALAPLLVDGSGNAHRAELNVEKLWNPHLGARGRLGVVEFRALRMPATPSDMAAVAALLRAVAARVCLAPYDEPLEDWGAALHDRFALPHFLAEDLRAVLADLAAHGLALGPAIRARLTAPRPTLATLALGGAQLTTTQALEFWPLLGDVASQETRTARLVDASSERVEILVRPPAGEPPGEVTACGVRVPLARVTLEDGADGYIAGVRYRAFVPDPGLHRGLAAHDPLVLGWRRGAETAGVALHAWIPGGGAYDGLPANAADAEARRKARVVPLASAPRASRAVPHPLGSLTIDLRRAR